MEFNHFLTSYMPDPSIESKQHFKNMIDQALLAEKLFYSRLRNKFALRRILSRKIKIEDHEPFPNS